MSREIKTVVYLSLIFCMLLSAGCGSKTFDSEPAYVQEKDAVIIYADGMSDVNHITAVSSDKTFTVEKANQNSFLRKDAVRNAFELLNLPSRWEKIKLGYVNPSIFSDGTVQPIGVVERTSETSDVLPDLLPGDSSPGATKAKAIIGFGFFLLLMSVYLLGADTQFLGDSGFTAQIMHGVIFLWLAREWERIWFYPYLGMLTAAFFIYVFFIYRRKHNFRNLKYLLSFIGFCLLYIMMLVSVVIPKDYQTKGAWSTHDCISLYINPSERQQIELLDKQGTVLASFELEPGLKIKTFCFWPDQESDPASVRLLKDKNVIRELDLDDRPEKEKQE